MKQTMRLLVAIAVVVGLAGGAADAGLILRGTDTLGNNLIYDTDLDITWYDFSQPKTFWPEQVDWADNLSVNFGGTVFDDWRLPTTDGDPNARGFNITTSEMGHLFYDELGGTAGNRISTSGDPDLALFDNLLDDVYWATGDTPNHVDGAPETEAWGFTFRTGSQDLIIFNSTTKRFGMAVRSGDVGGTAVVPEPSTMVLLGIGMAGIVLLRKKWGLRSCA